MVIELDNLVIGPGRTARVTLKMLFENLRYYPVLAFMWVGVKLLKHDPSLPAQVSGILLMGLTILLGLLTVWQSTWVAFSASLTTLSMLLPLRVAARFRKMVRLRSPWVYVLFAAVAGTVISSVMLLAASIVSALNRAGLL
ncbi:hypothetical protein [Acidovorax sp. PRC11]|uniref:hypothetical protein n=1 Tax=Acidovorax sp. PRC11 TaxID=2962592 RepID=UPI002881E097|nr:hypothetical protein [Acidovorax sp. PRC11]MDT0137724.1 hypothetical protein [Acidovorax sp. PRC11]